MTARSHLQFFELFGVPGAGKTTLASALAHKFRLRIRPDLSAEWTAQSRLRKFRYLLAAFCDLPCLFAAVNLAIQARLTSLESILRLGRMVAKSSWLRSRPDGLMLDQGFLQDLWSIFYSAAQWRPPPQPIAALIACLYRDARPRILVIDIDPESASRRISRRTTGDSRLDGLTEPQLSKCLVESAAIPEAIIEAASSAGLCVIRVDGELSTAALVRQLEPQLSGRESPARPDGHDSPARPLRQSSQ